MSSWLKKTFDYGEKGKVTVVFDDGSPRGIRGFVVEDPDGTTRTFDRAKGTVVVKEKGKEPTTHKADPVQPHKKSFTYPFPKEDWEIEIADDGTITWRRKVSKGKDGRTTEEIVTKGKKGRPGWTHEDGTTDKPKGTDEKEIDPPTSESPKPEDKPKPDDKPSGGGGGKPAEKPDKKPKKTPPKGKPKKASKPKPKPKPKKKPARRRGR